MSSEIKAKSFIAKYKTSNTDYFKLKEAKIQ